MHGVPREWCIAGQGQEGQSSRGNLSLLTRPGMHMKWSVDILITDLGYTIVTKYGKTLMGHCRPKLFVSNHDFKHIIRG